MSQDRLPRTTPTPSRPPTKHSPLACRGLIKEFSWHH